METKKDMSQAKTLSNSRAPSKERGISEQVSGETLQRDFVEKVMESRAVNSATETCGLNIAQSTYSNVIG